MTSFSTSFISSVTKISASALRPAFTLRALSLESSNKLIILSLSTSLVLPVTGSLTSTVWLPNIASGSCCPNTATTPNAGCLSIKVSISLASSLVTFLPSIITWLLGSAK